MENLNSFKLILCVTCVLLMITSNDTKYVGDDCVANGVSGICTLIPDCPPLMKEIQEDGSPISLELAKKLRGLNCGFLMDDPIVCCVLQSDLASQGSAEQDPISNKVGESAPVDVSNHRNLYLLPINCGLIDSDRITQGTPTKLYEMPWMVLLSYNSRIGTSLGCGGSLIQESYVLTAAHCVTSLRYNRTLSGVVLGEYDTTQDPDCEQIGTKLECAPPVQNISISEVIVHTGYNNVTLRNDIALLRLSEPADFTRKSQKPICLPSTPDRQNTALTGVKGLAAGWGHTEDTYVSPVLRQVDLPILSNEQCERDLGKYKLSPITIKQVCAGGVDGKDSCAGDSGGPLMYSNGPRQIQRGIVSYGHKICGKVGIPAVHTNIAYYMDWILDNMHE